MTTLRPLRRFRLGRVPRVPIALSLVVIVVYLGVLHTLDGRAESYFRELRTSDPTLYLSEIRESQGFTEYLAEYRQMWNYDSFQPAAPDFLVGRWTMRPGQLRLTPRTAPAQCSDPVTFDYGILLMLEAGGAAVPVNYRIQDQTVEVKAAGIDTYEVKLVSYGAQLDHIEFVPPNREEMVYAYSCGR